MAEVANASSLPNPNAAQGKSQRTPSAAQGQQKRNNRNRRNYTQSMPQIDGTVSDSVVNPTVSPRSKKQAKQRQSVASAVPNQNGNMGKAIAQKARPVSMGGPLLPATPAKEQAYAGPTFHASPAPSALPVPKFFSRSVPNVADQSSLQARMEAEKTEEKQEPEQTSSPESDVVAPVPQDAVQSPLDLFFKADQEEKHKSRSGSNTLSPEMAVRQPPATEPRNPFHQTGKSIYIRELDGNDDDMPSPRTVPPKNRPVLAERARSSPGMVPQSPQTDEQREAYTKSLKDLLFNNMNGLPQPARTPPQTQQRAQSDAQAFHTPSPFNRLPSGPTTPAPSTEQQNHYALHYGNRKLSPLFKAARNDTPPRPSGLRQEVQNGHSAPATNQQQPPRQMPQIDPNSFSRDYLNQHIRNPHTTSLPDLPIANGASSNPSAASLSGASVPSNPPIQRGVQAGGQASSASPRTGGSHDIRSMEDNLRRILNLNVQG